MSNNETNGATSCAPGSGKAQTINDALPSFGEKDIRPTFMESQSTATFCSGATTVSDLARRWHLAPQRDGKFFGPHPTDPSIAAKDGFVLCPEGNAFTNSGEKYTSWEVADLAGIPADDYAPCAEWKNQKGPQISYKPLRSSTRSANAKRDRGRPTKTLSYDYCDEHGTLLFRVQRKEFADGSKEFPTCRPDGQGGCVYGLSAGFYEPSIKDGVTCWYAVKVGNTPSEKAREFPEVRRTLWLLDEVLKADIVHIHEGEKAAQRHNEVLKLQGRYGREVATTSPSGAGKWRDEYAAVLAGKQVIVWPDNDEQGKKHGEQVCASCARVAASVKCITPEGLPLKGDICERLEAGTTFEELNLLVEATPEWTPSTRFESLLHEPLLQQPDAAQLIIQPSFEMATLDDLESWPVARWLVHGLLIEGTTSIFTADSGSFKSFIALDLALSIAAGTPFHGRSVQQGAVIYIAAEGAFTLRDRANAWLIEHKKERPQNFRILREPVLMADPIQVEALAAQITSLQPRFIVLDTLSQCALGLNENSNDEMARFVAGMMKLAQRSGAHVTAVHHNSKTGNFRGASAIHANVDARISLERPENDDTNTVFVRCEKQRGKAFAPFALRGEEVELPYRDEYGEVLSSLVFHVTGAGEIPGARAKKSATKSLSKTHERLLQLFDDLDHEFKGQGVISGTWLSRAGQLEICSPSGFYRALKQLAPEDGQGPIVQEGKVYRRVASTPAPTKIETESGESRGTMLEPSYSHYSQNPKGLGVVGVAESSAGVESRPRSKAKRSAIDCEPYHASLLPEEGDEF